MVHNKVSSNKQLNNNNNSLSQPALQQYYCSMSSVFV